MKKNESDDFSTASLDPEKIKEAAAKVADEAAELIRKHPLASVGGALIVGVLLGLFIKRK